VYSGLVGKTDGKRPLGRPRRRWEHNINLDFQEERCGGMDWIKLAQDRYRCVLKFKTGQGPQYTASYSRTHSAHVTEAKFTTEQSTKAQRGSRGIPLLFL
jgi:hypothetical protein